MANTPTSTLFPLLSDNIDLVTNGTYWVLDESREITWSMSKGLGNTAWENEPYYRGIIGGIYETYSTYMNVDFDYVGNFATPQDAYAGGSDHDYSIYKFDNTGWAAAMSHFPYIPWEVEDDLYTGSSGDIFINGTNILANEPAGPGTWHWALFMHELGHSFGLKHPHDDGGTGRPTFKDMKVENFDSTLYTIMSYNEVSDLSGNFYAPATPMFIDVLALQEIYGKNEETNAGNNTHTVEENNQFQTIWDASGVDTVDASAAVNGWEIQLPDTQWSNRVDTLTGYACLATEDEYAKPATLYWLMGDIENATGSAHADTLIGNAAANSFTGNGGDDSIDGGAGLDFANFLQVRTNYSVSKTTNGTITVASTSGTEGTDSLINIERVHFTDSDFAFDTDKGENGGATYRLYKAAFGRSPDDGGLTYWISRIDNGLTLTDMAEGFINSSEFKTLYGESPTPQAFVDSLYRNVLGREGDTEGQAYWVSEIESGNKSESQVLIDFSESDENIDLIGVAINDGFAYNLQSS